MDFSIYDAKAAGFTKVVFVIRKAIEAEFKESDWKSLIESYASRICLSGIGRFTGWI